MTYPRIVETPDRTAEVEDATYTGPRSGLLPKQAPHGPMAELNWIIPALLVSVAVGAALFGIIAWLVA